MYFHAPCSVVLCSVMCFYIVECNCNFYEQKKKPPLWSGRRPASVMDLPFHLFMSLAMICMVDLYPFFQVLRPGGLYVQDRVSGWQCVCPNNFCFLTLDVSKKLCCSPIRLLTSSGIEVLPQCSK